MPASGADPYLGAGLDIEGSNAGLCCCIQVQMFGATCTTRGTLITLGSRTRQVGVNALLELNL